VYINQAVVLGSRQRIWRLARTRGKGLSIQGSSLSKRGLNAILNKESVVFNQNQMPELSRKRKSRRV